MKKVRKNKEGQVYRCNWQRKGRVYTLTCSNPVSVTVRSIDLDDAIDKLISEIMTLTGDGEPYLQLFPDLPNTGAKQGCFEPEYYDIGYTGGSVQWFVLSGDKKDLTARGICEKCQLGLGSRTGVRRIITTPPRYDTSGFYQDRTLGIMISEDVLKHLLPHIKTKAKLIPVDVDPKISKKVRKNYFELSFEPDTAVVIPKEYDSISGWRCKDCGMFSVFWYNPRIVKSNTDGIERSKAIKPVVFVEKGPRKFISVNKSVHDAICADKTIQGFVSSRIAMFDPKQILSQEEIAKLKLRQIEP